MSYEDHIFRAVEENASTLIRLITKDESVHDFLNLYAHGFVKDDFINVVAWESSSTLTSTAHANIVSLTSSFINVRRMRKCQKLVCGGSYSTDVHRL